MQARGTEWRRLPVSCGGLSVGVMGVFCSAFWAFPPLDFQICFHFTAPGSLS